MSKTVAGIYTHDLCDEPFLVVTQNGHHTFYAKGQRNATTQCPKCKSPVHQGSILTVVRILEGGATLTPAAQAEGGKPLTR